MKTVSQTYRNEIKTLGKQIDSIITYELNGATQELGVNDLNSVTPHYEGNILKSVMKQLDIVSRTDIPLGTIINYQFGIKVSDNEVQDYRDNYEYVDLGNYIVYSSEKQEADNTYKIICYDKMLNSMKDYESMNITYPITIRNYLSAICTILGLTFGSINQNFVNYNKQITSELYLDADGNSLNYTFRDVLDDLAQVTASTICINDNDELEVRYINDTQDIIDEEYLKDINVNFGEKYGPINTISFKRSADSDVISKSIPSDLSDDLKKEISISDNQILNQDNRADYLDGVLNQLYGLEYYINDFISTGITFYDLCDKYNVSITKEDSEGQTTTTTYPCIMFNDEIEVTQGLQENVNTYMPDESITDYNRTTKDDRELSRASLIVDKVNGQITSKVGKDEIISTINQSAEQVQIDASKISLTGKTIALTGDNINITGNNFSVDTSGNMTATSGTIGGFHIEQKELWNKISETGYSYEDVYECSRYVVTYNSTWANVPSDVKLMYKEKFGFNNENDLKAKWDVAPANNPNGSITVADVMYMLNNLLDLGASGIKLIAGGNNIPASIQLSGPYSDEAIVLSADGSITLNKKDYSNDAINDTLKIDAKSVMIPVGSSNGYGLIGQNDASIIRDHGNGNVTLDATYDTLYLGWQHTNGINFLNGKGTMNSSGDLTINGSFKAGTIRNMYQANGTGGGTNTFVKLCNISYSEHKQGSFAGMKIYIGDGNNGRDNQNAFIDLTMQLGWTGSEDGRFGGFWELHPANTNFNLDNVDIIVIANSRTNYDVWLWTSKGYVVPNYTVDCEYRVTITPYYATQSSTPSGTKINIGKSIVPSVLTLYDNSSGTNGNVTLSETSANFSCIDIQFRSNEGNDYVGCQRIYNPNGKYASLMYAYAGNDNGTVYLKMRNIYINGNSITTMATNRYSEVKLTSSVSASKVNQIYITKVMGYR